MGIGIGDNKLIYKTTPQDVVWSETNDPNKWEVQEPYGYFCYDMRLDAWVQNREDTKGVAFYTAPPKKEWAGLTDQDILETLDLVAYDTQAFEQAYAIEAKLKEKNAESLQKEKKEWIGLDPEMMRNTPIEFNRGALWAERWLKEKNQD